MGRLCTALLFAVAVCVAFKRFSVSGLETSPTDAVGTTCASSLADSDATAEYQGAEQASKPASCNDESHANQERILYHQHIYVNPPCSSTSPMNSKTDCSSAGQGVMSSEIARLGETVSKSQEDTERKLKQILSAVSNLSKTCSDRMGFEEETHRQLERLSTVVSKQEAVIEWLTTAVSDLAGILRNSSVIPRDCAEVLAKGATSGVYAVQPLDDGGPFEVYCDRQTDGSGWTVFQRRRDGSVDFYRDWESYRQGFGDLDGEFWLGNDNLHRLTAQGDYKLRVDLQDFQGNSAYAIYDTFHVADGSDNYRLTVGDYSGTAGNSLSYHNNKPFSTSDRDNDDVRLNCAERHHGAWWYRECHFSNLNGNYFEGPSIVNFTGVNWFRWKGQYNSLKSSEMKIQMKN